MFQAHGTGPKIYVIRVYILPFLEDLTIHPPAGAPFQEFTSREVSSV
jgi:hypothetical protein